MKEVLLLKEAYRLVMHGSQLLILTLVHDGAVRWTWHNNPYVLGHTLSHVHQTMLNQPQLVYVQLFFSGVMLSYHLVKVSDWGAS